MISALGQLLAFFEHVFLIAANASLIIMLAINTINIASRAILNKGVVWVFPVTTVLFVWMSFLGFYVVYRRNKDIKVEFLVNLMGPSGRRALGLLVNVLVLIMMGIFLYVAPDLLKRQVGVVELVGIQRYWLSVPLFVSCLLIALQYVYDTLIVLGLAPQPGPTAPAEDAAQPENAPIA